MKSLTRFLLRLYPQAWRSRYQGELEALIEDSGSGWRMIPDLLREAIRMQFTSWSFGKLAVVLGLAGLILSAFTAAFIPTTYASSAEMRMTRPPGSAELSPAVANQQLAEHLMRMENETLSRTNLAEIIRDPRLDLYPSERASVPLEDVIERMRRDDIRINLDSLSTVAISFRYPDKLKAQQTVQALLFKLTDANQAQNRAVIYLGDHIWVLDPPTLPMSPRVPFLPVDWTDLIPYLFPLEFVSRAELQMVAAENSDSADAHRQLAEKITRIQEEVLSRSSLSGIILDPRLDLYLQERKSAPLEDVIDRMRKRDIRVSVELPPQSPWPTAKISFRYPDRRKAQQTLYALVTRFQNADTTERRQETVGKLPPPPIQFAGFNLDVLAPPRPAIPAKPNRWFFALMGTAAGVMLAAAARLLLRPRVTPA